MTDHTPGPWLLAENEALKAHIDLLVEKLEATKNEIPPLWARIAELEAAQEWKPIDTAPKDREILVCGAGKMWFARWNTDFEHWEGYFTHEPTHWIPLPKMEDE